MATGNKFEPGAVVKLFSGGPHMTIAYRAQSSRTDEEYLCVWADPNGVVHQVMIPATCLRPIETE